MVNIRKSQFTEKSKSSTYTAGIDICRNYGYKEDWHLNAIEFHHKDEVEAIKLRDKVFKFLSKCQ